MKEGSFLYIFLIFTGMNLKHLQNEPPSGLAYVIENETDPEIVNQASALLAAHFPLEEQLIHVLSHDESNVLRNWAAKVLLEEHYANSNLYLILISDTENENILNSAASQLLQRNPSAEQLDAIINYCPDRKMAEAAAHVLLKKNDALPFLRYVMENGLSDEVNTEAGKLILEKSTQADEISCVIYSCVNASFRKKAWETFVEIGDFDPDTLATIVIYSPDTQIIKASGELFLSLDPDNESLEWSLNTKDEQLRNAIGMQLLDKKPDQGQLESIYRHCTDNKIREKAALGLKSEKE
jgi:hypothetical protein